MPASLSGVIINEIQMASGNRTGGIDANNDGTFDALDQALELHNDAGASVDLTGWELWYVNNNSGSATQIATLNAFNLAPEGYYTIVTTSVSFNNLNNVGDGEESDVVFTQNTQSTYALYDPGTKQYVLVKGPVASTSETTMTTALTSAYPDATQSGTTESYANSTATGPATVQRVTDGSDTWESDAATLGMANCYAEDTLIATSVGQTAVQDLQIGDRVATADGRQVPVVWIGRQTVQKRFAGERAQLVRIGAGALGDGLPRADLYVTADHGMVLDGLIVNASVLVNGTSIDWVPLAETPERFTVYHVETEGHEVILANGAPSESYIDVPGRRAFDNFDQYVALYEADRIVPEMNMPRIGAWRLLPEATRGRLSRARPHPLPIAS